MPAAPRLTGPDWGRLLALGLVWGASFTLVRAAVDAMGPLTLVLARVALAAAALGLVLAATGRPFPRGRDQWGPLAVMAVLNNVVPFALLAWGLAAMPREVASSLASILNAAAPISTAVVAHLALSDERLTASRAVGVLVGVAGAVVVIGPSALGATGASMSPRALLGELACVAATVSYALAAVFARRFKGMGVAPLGVAFGQTLIAALILLPLALLVERPWERPVPGPAALAAVAVLGLVCTAAAYALYFRLVADAGATNASLVTLIVPVSALALGALVYGERLGLHHLAGLALIALGLAVIDGRALERLRRGRTRSG